MHRIYKKSKMDRSAFRRSVVESNLTCYKTTPIPGRIGGKTSSIKNETRYDKFKDYLIPRTHK